MVTGSQGNTTMLHALGRLLTRRPKADLDSTEDSDPMPPEPNGSRTNVIVGLGNPGRQYADTRHNLGFLVVDDLARRVHAPESRKRFKAEISDARRNGDRFVLVMPQTFMNESGVTVREVVRWYKVPHEQVMIVVDDLDLPFGQIRLRARGSAGGHNGLKSIFGLLGTQDVPRLRIGIGRGPGAARAHVLARFSKEEEAELPAIIAAAADIVERWVDNGMVEAMNVANDPANQPLVAR